VLTGGKGWDTNRLEPGIGRDTLLFFDRGDAAAGISDWVEFGVGKGKAGDDALFGGEGADRLRGGAGDDILRGDRGSDTYLFGRNDGVDTVKDYNGKDADPAIYGETSDRVLMGEGIAADQLWFSQHGDDLDIGIIGSRDHLRIDDWYRGGDYQVDLFELADGSRLMAAQVQQMVEAMAAFSPPQSGELDLSSELRQPLEPVIAASWQPAGSV